jgi:PAS domain S-box-containing protein
MITNAITVKTISILMVLIGAVFLSLSLPSAGKIRGNVESQLHGKWLVIISILSFILLGYLFFDLVLIFNLPFPVELVTGGVFLGGAVLVFMVINIFRSTVTARQKAEEALRESETCFHVIFDSINDAIIVQDTESCAILGVNDRMCRMFGYTYAEALQLTIGELMAENPHKDFCAWLDSANPRGLRSFECMAKSREGSSFWVEANIQSALIEGRSRRLLTLRDIDKRKHSEERLAKLNECFLGFVADHGENIRRLTILCGEMMGAACALYNKLETGMLQTLAHWNVPPDFKMTDDADGHLCNDVVKQGGDRLFCLRNLQESPYAVSDPNVMRYDLHTYIGIAVKCSNVYVGSLCVVFQKDFSPDEEDEKFMGILAVAVGVEEERRIAAENLLKAHAELESRVMERTAELAWANEQRNIDIDERKKAEEALWKSESVLRKIFDSIPDLLSVIDRDLRIVRSNWHGGYEYVSEDLRDKSPYCHEAYYPGQDRPCENCHTLEVFRTGKPAAMEKYNSRIGMIEAYAYPVFDESGNVIMVVEHVRDVTESRRLEEELRKVQKLESLGVLAGGIAHDFNNLLTGIMGNISLAKVMMNPQDKTFRRLDEAEKAVWRARDLTQQLLTFSKGGAPVRKTSSIEQIVMDSASFVLRGSNVRCEFVVPHNVWPVEADEGQMNQVINNLIINSDQAMPDGGVIKVRIENLSDGQDDLLPMKEGRYVRVSIEDHGVGIPEEYLQKIFDPYFTTKQKGSGLGLATAYSIINSHDGYISVESKVGAGTTFHVYLPASEKGLQAAGRTRDASIKGTGRILVMDDEEIIREVAEEILGHLGYRVVVCCDGAEALEEYREALASGDPFAAVIMDLTVPGGMGGKETMKRLQELDSKVIGIVSSGYSNDPILAHYREYGFSGVAAKPYNMEELGRELHDLFANGGLPPQ